MSAEPMIPKEEQYEVEARKFSTAAYVSLTLMFVELAGGYLANSLAIMTDATHLLSDVAGFVVGAFTVKLMMRKATARHSFGFQQVGVLGALLSVGTIWLMAGGLMVQGVRRLFQPEAVDGKFMSGVATLGLVCNLLMIGILGHEHAHGPGGCSHGHSHGHGDSEHGAGEHGCAGHAHDEEMGHTGHGGHGEHSGHSGHSGHGHCDHGHSDEHSAGHAEHGHSGGHSHGQAKCDGHAGHAGGHAGGHSHGGSCASQSQSQGEHGSHGGHGGHSGHGGHGGHGVDGHHGAHEGHGCGGHGAHEHGVDDSQVAESSLAMQAAMIHIIGDVVQSVGVVIAGLLIWLQPLDLGQHCSESGCMSNWVYADPICTLAFTVGVLFTTIGTLRSIVSQVMLTVPDSISPGELKQGLLSVPGVLDMHDLHVWQVGQGTFLTSHVRVSGSAGTESTRVLNELINVAQTKFKIGHATFQLEHEDFDPSLEHLRLGSHACHEA